MIFSTDVRIDGEVFGKVESIKNVIIGAEGFVKGFLRAKDLVVFGRIEGTIVVSGITILHESASIFGNLYTQVFEVSDGASITAKIVTCEKLEAIDEAQIFLAEERIKVGSSRRQVQNFSAVDISFEDPLCFEIADHIDSTLTSNQLLIDRIPALSGDILSPNIELNNTLDKDIVHFESWAIIKPIEIPKLISPLDIGAKIPDIDSYPETGIGKTTIQIIEAIINEQSEVRQDVPVIIIEVVNSVSDSKQNIFNKLNIDDSVNENGKFIHVGFPSPVSIAGYLGEPIKEDSQRMRKLKKIASISDPTLSPLASRKSKGYNLSGFEELRNLLTPVRFHDIKSDEKKNEPEKYNTKKKVESDSTKKQIGLEKSDFFLNDAIRQLPSDDYSSLFN